MDAETQEDIAQPGRLTALRSKLPKAAGRPPKSVFFVGTLFSGSTLIGRDMTTRIKQAHYVGELNNYTQFPGFSHQYAELLTCGPCALWEKKCGHFTDALRDQSSYEDILGIHDRLARSLDASVIVDGSKYVAWFRSAVEQRASSEARRTQINVIIVARNPIAFALSHRNRTGEPLWLGANIWRDTYVDALRTANSYGLPLLITRYEDYMADREGSLERLGDFLHLPLEAKADNSKIHDVGGNWSSYVPYVGKEQLNKHIEQLGDRARANTRKFVQAARAYWDEDKPRADTRWHGSLDAAEANAILSTPSLVDVAGLIGYNIAEVAHAAVRKR